MSRFSLIKPAKLKKGDKIAVAAPASPFDAAEFLKGVDRVKQLGFEVVFHPDIFSQKNYLAGSDERRLFELSSYLEDPTIKAILFARGGYGALRLLKGLDQRRLLFVPKILLGYSDLTSLLIYTIEVLGWTCLHGPVVAKDIGSLSDAVGFASMRANLGAEVFSLSKEDGLVFKRAEKSVRGILVGGCLSIVAAHLGTPYQLNTENRILFLEDVGEKPYKIDRLITQLILSGSFDRVRGLIVGPFKNSGFQKEALADFFEELLKDFDFPIAVGIPSGHLEDSITLPFGVGIEIDGQNQTIHFLEAALSI